MAFVGGDGGLVPYPPPERSIKNIYDIGVQKKNFWTPLSTVVLRYAKTAISNPSFGLICNPAVRSVLVQDRVKVVYIAPL